MTNYLSWSMAISRPPPVDDDYGDRVYHPLNYLDQVRRQALARTGQLPQLNTALERQRTAWAAYLGMADRTPEQWRAHFLGDP